MTRKPFENRTMQRYRRGFGPGAGVGAGAWAGSSAPPRRTSSWSRRSSSTSSLVSKGTFVAGQARNRDFRGAKSYRRINSSRDSSRDSLTMTDMTTTTTAATPTTTTMAASVVVAVAEAVSASAPGEDVVAEGAGGVPGPGPILKGPPRPLLSAASALATRTAASMTREPGNLVWKRQLIDSDGSGGGSDSEGKDGDVDGEVATSIPDGTAAKMARVGRGSLLVHPRKRQRQRDESGAEVKADESVDQSGGSIGHGDGLWGGRGGGRGHNLAGRGSRGLGSTGRNGGGRGGVGHPVAKRIRLNQPTEEKNAAACDGEGEASKEGKNMTTEATAQNATEAVKEKLTDFAYVETSKTSGRGRGVGGKGAPGRGRGRAGFGGRGGRGGAPPLPSSHMGLVRVRTELSSARTPVCPTFARGLPCSDPTCLRRHDVPPECAVPLCSYFQRDGRCLKMPPLGKCPFRHVKVDPNAAVCQSFQMLGYCEDLGCRMRHVRAKKGGQRGVGGKEGGERTNE